MVIPSRPTSQLDAFAADTLLQQRVELVQAIRSQALDKNWADAFVAKLGEATDLQDEWKAAQAALGGASADMSLDTPEKQLIWATALALEQAAGAGAGPVYKNFIEHSVARKEKQTAARHIESSLHDPGVTVSWGVPGSWFWFDPEDRHVNLDPLFSLVIGFEHARSVMAHEIGHSQLSVKFSPTMLALKDKADALREKSKTTPLSAEEFASIKRAEAEFNLRAGFYNSGEDACVNRYAVDRGKDYQQDMANSLNRVSFILQGTGQHILHEQGQPVLPKQPSAAAEAAQQIAHLSKALNLAFFTSTGLLANTDTDWKKAGIEPKAIRKMANGKAGADPFQKLVSASVGPSGLAALQPTSFDYRIFSFMFRARAARYCEHRNKLMDELWDTYAADQAKLVLDAIEDKAKQAAQQPPKDQKPSEQKGKGQGQGQGGGSGQSKNEGQGSGSGAQEGKPDNKSGSKSESKSGEGSSGGSGNGEQKKAGGPPSQPNPDGQGGGGGDSANPSQSKGSGSGQQRNEAESSGDGDGGFQTGKPKSGPSKTGKNGGGENQGEQVQVEGAGQLDLPERLPATPGEARRREQPAKDKDESRTLDAETVADLLRAAMEGRLDRSSANGQGQAPTAAGSPGGDFAAICSQQGGTQRGVDLAKLASGNWTDYQARVNELGPFIKQVERKLDYVRSQQVHETRTFSDRRVELPIDGNILGRLDRQAHENLQIKMRTGQHLDKHDRARWRPDSIKTEPTTSETMILIDGSGSMNEGLPGGGRRIWSAVQSGAVIYEASKRAKFDAFVGVWGDDQLRLVVKPGDTPAEAGKAFERVKNGINSGTLLSSNLQQAAEALSKHRNLNGSAYSGKTHIFIISDGELNGGDDKPCIRMLERLYRLGQYVTVDIAILGGARRTPLHDVAQALSARGKNFRINVVHGDRPEEIPLQLAKLLEQRFRESGGSVLHAIPDAVKRQNLARAARSMANS